MTPRRSSVLRLNRVNRQHYSGRLFDLIDRYTEAASILENTRLAGHSYKRWVLKDYMALLRLRSLLSRGRARAGPETTLVAALLFGSLSGFADMPNECFWRVVKYAWLGDWRHP